MAGNHCIRVIGPNNQPGLQFLGSEYFNSVTGMHGITVTVPDLQRFSLEQLQAGVKWVLVINSDGGIEEGDYTNNQARTPVSWKLPDLIVTDIQRPLLTVTTGQPIQLDPKTPALIYTVANQGARAAGEKAPPGSIKSGWGPTTTFGSPTTPPTTSGTST